MKQADKILVYIYRAGGEVFEREICFPIFVIGMSLFEFHFQI